MSFRNGIFIYIAVLAQLQLSHLINVAFAIQLRSSVVRLPFFRRELIPSANP